ncbi:MAG: terminase [Bacteroidetes bacterium]|nr:terminase [Bacteroidota bacterium]
MGLRKDRQAQNELAFLLFMAGEQQKDIAKRVGVSEKTICDWIRKAGWKERRAAKTISRGELINKTLEMIGDKLEAGNVNADELIKLAKSIEMLDKKSSAVMVIDILIEFGKWIKNQSAFDPEITLDFIKKVTRYQDSFITDKITQS